MVLKLTHEERDILLEGLDNYINWLCSPSEEKTRTAVQVMRADLGAGHSEIFNIRQAQLAYSALSYVYGIGPFDSKYRKSTHFTLQQRLIEEFQAP